MILNRTNFKEYKKNPEKVIQFGSGNFLRCFINWQLDIINEKTNLNAGVAIVKPSNSERAPLLDVQDGLYTTIIRGIDENQNLVKDFRVISSVNREIPIYKQFNEYLKLAHNPEMRFIFSNTTEAGIAYSAHDKYDDTPQETFPGKLTRLLHERFKTFEGATDKGFIILPCELIDYNGEKLKEIVLKYATLWNLEEKFKLWLEESNVWCSTLVDRIVTGYPFNEKEELEKELGYEDQFMVTGEYFHLFVIQGPKDILEKELKLKEVNLNIKIVEDLKNYKMIKVGILNGAHTSMVPVSYLYGIDTVKETLDDEVLGEFVKETIYKEIIPALEMDETELLEFADAVINRFKNPYVEHFLKAISLNSMTKYKTRILPQLLNYKKKTGELPKKLVFSLASMIRFYKGDRNGEIIDLKDDRWILDLYSDLWNKFDGTDDDYKKIINEILGLESHWDINLNTVEGLAEQLFVYLKTIDQLGMKRAIKEVL